MEANGIVLSPDPRLRQECAVIEEITPAIEALAERMKKMQRIKAVKEYQDALARGARPGETE